MSDDIRAQLDFLQSTTQQRTERDLWNLAEKCGFLVYFVDILELNTLGLHETVKNSYVITTSKHEVVCTGNKHEIDILYQTVEEFYHGERRPIGELKLTYVCGRIKTANNFV